MSTATCITLLNCRRADALALALVRGAEFARAAHEAYGCDSDVKPAVEAALKGYLREMAADFRREHPEVPTEEFVIQVSEFRLAIVQAVEILFPPVEE